MSFPNSADLAILRNAAVSIQADTATNSRTSTTTSAWIDDRPSPLTIERGFRVRSYIARLPFGTDCLPSDALTFSTDGGVYAVQQVLRPRTSAVDLDLICVPASLLLASLLATESAVFRHPTLPAQTVAAQVYVVDQLADVQEYGTTPAYRWLVFFEASLRYPNSGQIGDSHQLVLASIFGTDGSGHARFGSITKPRPVLHGLPYRAAFVKEIAG